MVTDGGKGRVHLTQVTLPIVVQRRPDAQEDHIGLGRTGVEEMTILDRVPASWNASLSPGRRTAFGRHARQRADRVGPPPSSTSWPAAASPIAVVRPT